MKKIIFILSILLGTLSLNAQMLDTIFNGYLSPLVDTAGSAPTWHFKAQFVNEGKTFTGATVADSSVILVSTGGKCYELDIDSAGYINGLIRGTVTDSSGVLSDLPNYGAIVSKTSSGLYAYVSGVPEVLQSCIQTHNLLNTVTTTGTATSSFDSDRPILRVPTAGTVIGGATVDDWLNYWYFTAPTLSLNLSPTTTVYEVGDTSYITVSGTTTNSGSATLSNGYLRRTAPTVDTVDTFGATTSYSFSFSFYPQKDSTAHYKQLTYSFAAKQDWVFGAESGTATSTTRTVTAVYPVLYGMSATDFSVGGDPYTGLTKLVQAEGDKTVSLTGSGFIYYAVPKTWSDFTLSSIIDHNGFNVTPSFTSYDITVSSTGLINDWVNVDYKLYKLNTTTTTSGYAYQFNR